MDRGKMMMMRKDKAVAVESSSSKPKKSNRSGGSGSDFDDLNDVSSAKMNANNRNPSSKYDFVKVKVWLGDNADHYYVFSRFLLSRMLTVTKIPNHVAIKIALELKKLLIDNSLLDVSQSDLEANLFKLMERRGYGQEYINRYKMMTRFHHQRVPLVILVCGTACVGKSTVATQIAQRLNLPNVLQTDMVYELLRTSTDAPLASTPVWARKFSSAEELITEFCRECRIVRKGLAGDLKKAMKDGKPIIIEGIHLDPSIYLMDEGGKAPSIAQEKKNPVSVASNGDPGAEVEKISTNDGKNCNNGSRHMSSQERISSDLGNKVTDSTESIALTESVSENKGEAHKDLDADGDKPARKEKSGADPIIIPVVLKMAEFDHKALLEEWISTRTFYDKWSIEYSELVTNLKTIQDYLCSFKSRGQTVVTISATTFAQTMDWVHGYLLQRIEQGISSESSSNSNENVRPPRGN